MRLRGIGRVEDGAASMCEVQVGCRVPLAMHYWVSWLGVKMRVLKLTKKEVSFAGKAQARL